MWLGTKYPTLYFSLCLLLNRKYGAISLKGEYQQIDFYKSTMGQQPLRLNPKIITEIQLRVLSYSSSILLFMCTMFTSKNQFHNHYE